MRVIRFAAVFLFIASQSYIHSVVSVGLFEPRRDNALLSKRFLPQAEQKKPDKRTPLFDPQAENPEPGKALNTKRLASQAEAEKPEKEALLDNLFDPQAEKPKEKKKKKMGPRSHRLTARSEHAYADKMPPPENMFDSQVHQDQDACMWRCQEWCRQRCQSSGNEECLDGCLNVRGHRWRRCINRCKRGDMDRPGGDNEEEEEEEEEEEYMSMDMGY